MTAPIVSSLGQPPQPSDKRVAAAVSYAAERSSDWQRVSAFFAEHPEIAGRVTTTSLQERLFAYIKDDDPSHFMASAAQACVDAGGRVEQCAGPRFGGVDLFFGEIRIRLHAEIGKVFSRRVIGSVEQVEYTLNFDLPTRPSVDAEVRANALRLQEEQAADDLTREQIGQALAGQAEASA